MLAYLVYLAYPLSWMPPGPVIPLLEHRDPGVRQAAALVLRHSCQFAHQAADLECYAAAAPPSTRRELLAIRQWFYAVRDDVQGEPLAEMYWIPVAERKPFIAMETDVRLLMMQPALIGGELRVYSTMKYIDHQLAAGTPRLQLYYDLLRVRSRGDSTWRPIPGRTPSIGPGSRGWQPGRSRFKWP